MVEVLAKNGGVSHGKSSVVIALHGDRVVEMIAWVLDGITAAVLTYRSCSRIFSFLRDSTGAVLTSS